MRWTFFLLALLALPLGDALRPNPLWADETYTFCVLVLDGENDFAPFSGIDVVCHNNDDGPDTEFDEIEMTNASGTVTFSLVPNGDYTLYPVPVGPWHSSSPESYTFEMPDQNGWTMFVLYFPEGLPP